MPGSSEKVAGSIPASLSFSFAFFEDPRGLDDQISMLMCCEL